jgi:hypothetical protein
MAKQFHMTVVIKKRGAEAITRKIGMGAGFHAASKAAGHNFVGQMGQLANEIATHLDDPDLESALITIDKESL